MPAADLIKPGDTLVPPGGVDASLIWMQPVVDGWVLPKAPGALLAKGEQNTCARSSSATTAANFLLRPADGGRAMIAGFFGGNADARASPLRIQGRETRRQTIPCSEARARNS